MKLRANYNSLGSKQLGFASGLMMGYTFNVLDEMGAAGLDTLYAKDWSTHS